jgi:hypothetical protein
MFDFQVGLSALIALYHNLFQMQDKKFMNKYWDVCKKVKVRLV